MSITRSLRLMLAPALLASAITSQADVNCNPTSVGTCGLPFPSNYWSLDDSNSPTGKRLSVPNGVVRDEVIAQLPVDDGFTPEGIFNNFSGFSAATPVTFEFTSAPDAATLPYDGGTAVMAFDLTTGEQVAIRTKVSDYAQSDKVTEKTHVIEVFPQVRWGYGHEILVVVTDKLDLEYLEPGIVSKLLSGTSEQRSYTYKLTSLLTSLGINSLNVRNATRFTVRDRAEVVQPMQTLVDNVWDMEHPVRNLKTTYNYINSNIAARVDGEVLIYNYRTNDGTGVVDFDKEPTEQWIEFRLTLPKASRQGPVPVALYAHGLGATKETDSTVTDMNADIGIATYSVGFPNHGDRAEADGGYVLSIATTDQLAKTIGMIQQNAIDFASAHRALQTSLANIDVVGKSSWSKWCSNCPDGVADIDATNVMMEGTSLGGVLGSVYGALSPDLKGAVYHVTGVGITSILSDSILWDAMFVNLVPSESNGSEAVLLRSSIQQALDYGDSINYIDYFRYPQAGKSARPLMITTGAGDTIVGNQSSVAAANLVDLPIVGEPLYDMPGVRLEADYDEDGYGIRHYKPIVGTVPLIWDGTWAEALSGASGHLIFTRKSKQGDQQEFIKRFIMN
ncbi:MAG: hypothetical protein KBT79_09680 [Thalassolituus oleivorans]|nr:hypothetical protein [Thalassolituus oleivorans]